MKHTKICLKLRNITITIICSLALFLLLLSTALNPLCIQFKSIIESNPSAFTLGVPQTIQATHEMLMFLWFGQPYTISLSTQAISHMQDVRTLFIVGQISLFVLIATSAILLRAQLPHIQKKIIMMSATITLCATLLFSIIGSFFFDQFFTFFHEILFRNNNWLFLPTDTLVQYFPTYFFICASAQTSLWIVICCALLIFFCKFRRTIKRTY